MALTHPACLNPLQAIFYFLHGHCLIAFAFACSSLFTSTRTAVTCAFVYLFGTGLIGELLLKVGPAR